MHPLYSLYADRVQECRDVISGEDTVKSKGTLYLPPLPSHIQKPDRYRAFKDRATFFNATARTLAGLVGAVFRKPPIIQNLPPALSQRLALDSFTPSGSSLVALSEEVFQEILTTGRVGILLDRPFSSDDPQEDPRPFAVLYRTEDILNWTTQRRGRTLATTSILLRELEDDPAPILSLSVAPNPTYRHRLLALDEEGYYYQQLLDSHLSPTSGRIYLTNRGARLRHIPFISITPASLTLSPEKPPLLDIVKLNLSHFRSYASLEHGRMYTAFPQYYVSFDAEQTGISLENSEDQEQTAGVTPYSVDADAVWEIEGGRPGILEFNGSGLNSLENAIEQKAGQIQALGGRLVTPMKSMPATSGVALELQELGDAALLLRIASRVAEAMNLLISWTIDWEGLSLPDPAPNFSFQASFTNTKITGRELRAILALFKEHAIPRDVLYHGLRESGVLPPGMTLDEFQELLDNPDQLWRLDPRIFPPDNA